MAVDAKRRPWCDDDPQAWQPLPEFARTFLRKHPDHVRRMAIDGTLESAGFKVYYDGSRWFVRIPSRPAIADKLLG